jgi:hypothetical protein
VRWIGKHSLSLSGTGQTANIAACTSQPGYRAPRQAVEQQASRNAPFIEGVFRIVMEILQ